MSWGSVPNNLASPSVLDTRRALEIKTLWGKTVLDVLNVIDAPVVTMGDQRKIDGQGPFQTVVRCDIEVPSAGLPEKRFPLAERIGTEGTNYAINIAQSFGARIERADGTVVDLGSRATNEPVGYLMQPAETLYLDHEEITLQVRYVHRVPFEVPPLRERLNYTWTNVLLLAFFVHAMLVVTLMATPIADRSVVEDFTTNRVRLVEYLYRHEPKKRTGALLDTLTGDKAAGQEGRLGPKKKNPRNDVAKGRPDGGTLQVAGKALESIFGGKDYGDVLGPGGLGSELREALRQVAGSELGDAAGLDGLGSRGSGPGGGGHRLQSVGLGGKGLELSGKRWGPSRGIGPAGPRGPIITTEPPVILGSLPKDVIHQVIKSHIAQIRYCYERELQSMPGLFGKVATQFVIGKNGKIKSAKVTQTTIRHRELERCVLSRIRSWQFPKPNGGGIVIVNYPFVFKTSG